MSASDRPYVVVGIDGSSAGVAAAEYAADWAAAHGMDLELMHGYAAPAIRDVCVTPFPAVATPPSASREMLARLADTLRHRRPDLHVDVRYVPGDPVGALVDESQWAGLTIVGSRDQAGTAGAATGAVAGVVAAYAAGPVIVVRPVVRTPSPDRPVLVGVDGSEGGDHALAFGFPVADFYHAGVVALHSWWPHTHEGVRDRRALGQARDAAAAERVLRDAVAAYAAMYPDVGIVHRLVRSADPVAELVDRSDSAGLVVVGARGGGGFSGLLVGSTAARVVRRAGCPVAVARDRLPRRAVRGAGPHGLVATAASARAR